MSTQQHQIQLCSHVATISLNIVASKLHARQDSTVHSYTLLTLLYVHAYVNNLGLPVPCS